MVNKKTSKKDNNSKKNKHDRKENTNHYEYIVSEQEESEPNGNNNYIFTILLILIVLILLYFIYYYYSKYRLNNEIKNLQIHFVSDGGQNSQIMTNLLTKEGTIQSYIQDTGPVSNFTSYPTFYIGSSKNINVSGLFSSSEDIINALNDKALTLTGTLPPASQSEQFEQSDSDDLTKREDGYETDIIMFSKASCGYCIKAKEDIEKNGPKKINIIDYSSPKGQKLINKLGLQIPGFPFYYNPITKKQSIGYRSLNDIVNDLSS